jgi:hypothetical protein
MKAVAIYFSMQHSYSRYSKKKTTEQRSIRAKQKKTLTLVILHLAVKRKKQNIKHRPSPLLANGKL